MINVTDVAKEKIYKQLSKRKNEHGIKIGVKTTGCSGLAYVLEFVDNIDSSDIAISLDNFSVFINPKHEPYLKGLTLDYVRQGLNEGFEFLNPNEKDRCGCGSSFRV